MAVVLLSVWLVGFEGPPAAKHDGVVLKRNGFALRAYPLVGSLRVRSGFEILETEPNRTTYLAFDADEAVFAYGGTLQMGWQQSWKESIRLMLGLGYTQARGQTSLRRVTPLGVYDVELRPRYDSFGVVVDAAFWRERLGFEVALGGGATDAEASSELDRSSGELRYGYLWGTAIRYRWRLRPDFALSLGANYQVLGFFPTVFGDHWYRSSLSTVRLGAEFDVWGKTAP